METHEAPAKPFLLLDVDGPLNPTLERVDNRYVSPHREGETPFKYRGRTYSLGGGLAHKVVLADEYGPELKALRDHFTLVWATTWEQEANRLFWKYFSLPSMPVIRWPHEPRAWVLKEHHRGSWKTPHILAWLDEHGLDEHGNRRPWVWVDDEVNGFDRRYVARHYGDEDRPGSAVRRWLFRIEDHHGLRANDFTDLREWATTVATKNT